MFAKTNLPPSQSTVVIITPPDGETIHSQISTSIAGFGTSEKPIISRHTVPKWERLIISCPYYWTYPKYGPIEECIALFFNSLLFTTFGWMPRLLQQRNGMVQFTRFPCAVPPSSQIDGVGVWFPGRRRSPFFNDLPIACKYSSSWEFVIISPTRTVNKRGTK